MKIIQTIHISRIFNVSGDRGRRRSKFVLYRRNNANGVVRSKHYRVKTPQSSQAILNTQQHSISYTLSRNQAVIVEYTHDETTDLFQVNSQWLDQCQQITYLDLADWKEFRVADRFRCDGYRARKQAHWQSQHPVHYFEICLSNPGPEEWGWPQCPDICRRIRLVQEHISR